MSERKEPTVSSVLNSLEEQADNRRSRSPQQAQKRSSPRTPPPRSSGSTRTVVEKKSSSGFVWFTFLVTLVAVGSAGYAILQLEEASKAIASQNQRIAQLEDKLTVSDDSATQSLVSLRAQLNEVNSKNQVNTSEIAKLWTTRNVNRDGIAENKKAVVSMDQAYKKDQKTLKSLNGTVSKVEKAVESINAKVNELSPLASELASTSQTVSEHDLLLQSVRERVATQNDTLKTVNNKVATNTTAAKKVDSLQKRVKNTEEAITSLDAFRRTVNRDLLQLKQVKP